jgi:hypothetical protein
MRIGRSPASLKKLTMLTYGGWRTPRTPPVRGFHLTGVSSGSSSSSIVRSI